MFEVELKVAQCSMLIKQLLEDLASETEDDDEVIPLPNVSAAILRKVIEWAQHHRVKSCLKIQQFLQLHSFCE